MESIVEVHKSERLVEVRGERCSFGNVYFAQDRRGQYLFVAQRIDSLRDAIDVRCHERLSRSSMYASASPHSAQGYHGSFNIERVTLTEAPAYLEQHRSRFTHVLLVTRRPDLWIRSTECGPEKHAGGS